MVVKLTFKRGPQVISVIETPAKPHLTKEESGQFWAFERIFNELTQGRLHVELISTPEDAGAQ